MRRDVEVSLEFLSTDEGGRVSAVRNGYRPQFHYDGQDWDAAHEYPDVEQVLPGQRARAFLTFLSPSKHLGKVAPGKPFEIREGSRIVARGRVEKLLDLVESASRELLHQALEAYYLKLGAAAADETDRNALDLYDIHLSQARKLRELLRPDVPLSTFRDEVVTAQQAFGRSFLAGKHRDAVETSFNDFVELVHVTRLAG